MHLQQLLANALVQSGAPGPRDKSNDRCRSCGGMGHWATDPSCPKYGQNPPQRAFNGGRGGRGHRAPNRNNQGRGGRAGRGHSQAGRFQARSNQPRHPRFPLPRNGESEIKTAEGGKKYYWCAKCDNWTISHGTDNHKTREQLRTNVAIATQSHNFTVESGPRHFNQHPTVWMIKDVFAMCAPNSIPIAMAAPTISSRPNSILFNSGANCCITNDINDFNGNYTPFNKN
eukprot:scaffold11356_cov111-Amphora_coffeaeformis.AAC.1